MATSTAVRIFLGGPLPRPRWGTRSAAGFRHGRRSSWPGGCGVAALAQQLVAAQPQQATASALCWNGSAVTRPVVSEIAATGRVVVSATARPRRGWALSAPPVAEGDGVGLAGQSYRQGSFGQGSLRRSADDGMAARARKSAVLRIPCLGPSRIRVRQSCRWPGADGGVRSRHDRAPADDSPCPARRGSRVRARRPPAHDCLLLLAEVDGAPLAIVAVDGGRRPPTRSPGWARRSRPAHVPGSSISEATLDARRAKPSRP